MMENLKIAIVTPWFGEFAGGAETLAKSLAVEFNKRGIETIVLTTCCKSPYSDWWNDFYEAGEHYVYGVKTFRYEVNKNTKKNYEKSIDKFTNNHNKMSDKEKSDFFVCGINSDTLVKDVKSFLDDGWEIITLPYFQGLTHYVINAYPEKVNLVPCFHDEDPFYWYSVELILKNCKNIFYNSKEEKAMTIKQYGHNVGKKVIEGCVSGVGIEKVFSDDKPSIFLPNQKYFVYMGRKEIGKNVHLLVNWFKEFKNKYKNDVKLVFIGGGDNNLVPDGDDFTDYGFISESDKQYIIKNAEALINLSVNESFSLVIMEAWLQGIPVVVHGDCPVTKGHAIRANGGLYPTNKEEFFLCLKYIIENSEISKVIGQNGRQYVENNFSYDVVLEKYLNKLRPLNSLVWSCCSISPREDKFV